MCSMQLSIIVPVYNAEKYLKQCLESILFSHNELFELILVDDGSTDNSSQLCDEYAAKYDVKVIHKNNGGIISARKAGLEIASGTYIGFVDADDWIEPNMYERLIKEALVYNADIVSCSYFVDSENSSRIVRAADEETVIKNIVENRKFTNGILANGFDWVNNRNITPSVCNKIIKKDLLDSVYEKIDERIVWDEDTVAVLSATLDSECIVLIPDSLYHYRKNILSISHTLNKSVLQNYVYVFNELDRISQKHNGILDKQIPFFALTAVRTVLEVGFGIDSDKQYMFPFGKIVFGSKIIVYGAGQVGKAYYRELTLTNFASRLYLTDSDSKNWCGDVISPSEAFNNDYDIVIIAVENEKTAQAIKVTLIEKGIPEKKLFWEKPILLKGSYSFWPDKFAK